MAKGERVFGSSGVNPFTSLVYQIRKAIKESEGDVTAAMKPLVEVSIGAKLDPVIGLYNYFEGDPELEEDAIYDILGVAPSYRPNKKSTAIMSREEYLKDIDRDLYDKMYGPGSVNYDQKKRAKELEDRLQGKIKNGPSSFQK